MRAPAYWQQRGTAARALWPLSQAYLALARLDRWRHTRKRLSVPVIAIGNLVAGGSGKTPTTIALAQQLQERGYRPAILSRGYGGLAQNALRVEPEQQSAETVGDEPQLLAQTAPTWVGRQRYSSGLAAIAAGADILMLDDGMQHHGLHKDLTLCLVDSTRGLGNGWPLPAGPLRESRRGLRRTEALILVGEGDWQPRPPHPPVFRALLQPSASAPSPQRVVAFAGIAYPAQFERMLRKEGFTLVHFHSFGDHEPISDRLYQRMRLEADQAGANLITTEKDWQRMSAQQRRQVIAYPVTMRFEAPAKLLDFIEAQLALRRSSPSG